MTPDGHLTPAEHRAEAEAILRQLKSRGGGPGSLAYHGLSLAAVVHVLIGISDGLDTLAAYLEPPDIPGLPKGWQVTTPQSKNGSHLWGYVLTRPGKDPDVSRYQFGSPGTALLAALKYAGKIATDADWAEDAAPQETP
jgi:hypothetical protein